MLFFLNYISKFLIYVLVILIYTLGFIQIAHGSTSKHFTSYINLYELIKHVDYSIMLYL